MLKKGIFNADLKLQTIIIGFIYCGLAVFGILYGVIVMQYSFNHEQGDPNNLSVDEQHMDEYFAEIVDEVLHSNNTIQDDEKRLDEYFSNVIDNVFHQNPTTKDEENLEKFISNTLDQALNLNLTEKDVGALVTVAYDEMKENNKIASDISIEQGDDYEDDYEDYVDAPIKSASKEASNKPKEQKRSENIQTDMEYNDTSDNVLVTENRKEKEEVESAEVEDSSEETELTAANVDEDSSERNETDLSAPQGNGLTPRHIDLLHRFKDNEGVEAIFASVIRLMCSILLIAGVRTRRHWFLVPWIVEETVEMAAVLFKLIVQTILYGGWSLAGFLMMVVLYFLGGYFLYSVISCHSLLKRMSKQSNDVISSVSHGGFQKDMNYRKLQDDTWVIDPPISIEFRDRDSGFTRENLATEENDDYVLYVKN